MPVQPTDQRTDAVKTNPDVFGDTQKQPRRQRSADEDNTGVENEPNQANYGFDGRADLDTEAEETQSQEYKAGGLQETSKYMLDGKVRGEQADQTPKETEWKHGKGKSGCGC